jgi:hypothetical protein
MNSEAVAQALAGFMRRYHITFEKLSSRQTQILELAAVVGVTQHYRSVGFNISVTNPGSTAQFVVKASTRGHPSTYSLIELARDGDLVELHMNLLVRGAHDDGIYCVDVAIVNPRRVPRRKAREPWLCIENPDLLSFVEVKKLVVYPMLLAQFLGIVHEIKPEFMRAPPPEGFGDGGHLPPTLIALGHFSGNSRLIVDSFVTRGFRFLVAESFDMRLAATRRTPGTSPFYRGPGVLAPAPEV